MMRSERTAHEEKKVDDVAQQIDGLEARVALTEEQVTPRDLEGEEQGLWGRVFRLYTPMFEVHRTHCFRKGDPLGDQARERSVDATLDLYSKLMILAHKVRDLAVVLVLALFAAEAH